MCHTCFICAKLHRPEVCIPVLILLGTKSSEAVLSQSPGLPQSCAGLAVGTAGQGLELDAA